VDTVTTSQAHPALLGTPEGERVRCGLCPNACLIAEGKLGVCGARGVVGGELRALTYGLVSSLAADPIEKKPVFHYRPGTSVMSAGSVGCSMRCGHCQNWQISRADEDAPTRFVPPEMLVALALDAGCEGVAFTYNEPVIWLEYVRDTAREARSVGLFTVMVTNGYVTEAGLDLFAEVIDVWRTDVKAFSEEAQRTLCRVGHAEAVRAAAERAMHVHGMHVECVTNIVPTINDADSELAAIAEWIAGSLSPDTPWHVSRFVPYLEFSHLPPTPLATLERAVELGHSAGLHHVYLGNVATETGEDTRCPSCGATAVSRTGFSARVLGVDELGRCSRCGADLNVRMSNRKDRPA